MCENFVLFCCNKVGCIIAKHNFITPTKIQPLCNVCIEQFWYKKIVRMFSIYVLNIPIPNISDMPLYSLYGLTESEQKYIDDLP